MNLKVLGLAASLAITAGLASCSGGANQATPSNPSASPAMGTTGDAMKGDAMKKEGDAMKKEGDAMKGDAMKK
ncbi:hypothetical protein JOY44_08555 [Phormidium sp. CLA17]|nr:hypothetical protein [Leptolyngbya sp. Cla-17]